jgi:sortase B
LLTAFSAAIFFVSVFVQATDLIATRKENNSLEKPEFLETENNNEIYLSAFDLEMREINPDYICWIKIDDTVIDYPVVRAENNEKYLDLSFYGEENVFGALFMDYRCAGDYVPHIIIYGHNSKFGDMFGGLRKFLNDDYLSAHSIITLLANDRLVKYEIYSARQTDVNDAAYEIYFSSPALFQAFAEKNGAPPDAVQILTLSTCVSGNNADERVVVQGRLIES